MVWSDNLSIMLLTHEFYSKFTDKSIIDGHKTSGVLIALTMDSKEAVQEFADKAKANGGSYFEAEPNKGLDFMFGLEVSNLDDHTFEPVYMDMSKFPAN